MSKITKYHKQVSGSNQGEAYKLNDDKTITYDIDGDDQEDSGTHLSHFNDLISADAANFNPPTPADPLYSTTTQQQKLIELRQDLANIYSLVMAYANDQDTAYQQQQQRIDILSQMEELNQETIKDTTGILKNKELTNVV